MLLESRYPAYVHARSSANLVRSNAFIDRKGGKSWWYRVPLGTLGIQLGKPRIIGISLDDGILFWSCGQMLYLSPLNLVDDVSLDLYTDLVSSKSILRKINNICRVFFDTLREEIGNARGTPGQLLLIFEEKAPIISCSMNYAHRQEVKKLHKQLEGHWLKHSSLEIINIRRHMQYVWEEFDALLGLRYDQKAEILRSLRFMQEDPLSGVLAKVDHLLQNSQQDTRYQALSVMFEAKLPTECLSIEGKYLSNGHVQAIIGNCLQFETFGSKLISASSYLPNK